MTFELFQEEAAVRLLTLCTSLMVDCVLGPERLDPTPRRHRSDSSLAGVTELVCLSNVGGSESRVKIGASLRCQWGVDRQCEHSDRRHYGVM